MENNKMNKIDYARLDKLLQKERNNILEKQKGLDILEMDKSIDKAVLNNLSIKLSRNDLEKIVSILAHYYDDRKGNIAHGERQKTKIGLRHQILRLRNKQKKSWKK